jgi:hypothetical protein
MALGSSSGVAYTGGSFGHLALEQTSTGRAVLQEPSGEQDVLDRTKPTGLVVGVVIVALVSLAIGVFLVREPDRVE